MLAALLPTTPHTAAARYALLGEAKRLRPCLVLLTTEMVGGDIEQALIPAACLELIHTYSLVHDDLPCMDDDDTRRGRPTVHKAFDEATAVLAGDLLLTYAFERLATAPLLSAEKKITLITILSQASGLNGMLGGQMLDLEASQEVDRLHSMKTGALFECALHFGAVIGGVEPKPLVEFGKTFGLLFQAIDDCLDNDSPLGKEAGDRRAQKLLERSLKELSLLPYPTQELRSLIMKCVPDRISSSIYAESC